MRFGSFVTTFDRPEVLRGTLATLLAQTRVPDVLFVVDNGTDDGSRAVVAEFPDVRYHKPGENLGSAGGTARGMELLHAAGCDWLHSVDDDNPPRTGDTIERMIDVIARRRDDDQLGAVAASGARWDWQTGEIRRIPDDELQGDLEVDIIGGSNQLTVRREVIDDIGPPEKALFFGFYDPLYSLRMKRAGYSLWIDGDLMREYRTLARRLSIADHRSLRPQDPKHALWRRYYVTRNYIHRMLHTFDRPDLARREVVKATARSAASWTRGLSYGWRYTTLEARGILDGYRGRLGRRVEPVRKPSGSGLPGA